jgi:hypothetical protein
MKSRITGNRIIVSLALFLIMIEVHVAIAQTGTSADGLLPPAKAVKGWKPEGDRYYYTPDDLFHYINGAADLFNSYDLVKLTGSEYSAVSDNNKTMTVDIYDMNNKLNAFGIYQSKIDPDCLSLAIGAGAFGNDQYLFFYKDRFYVEIQAYLSDSDAKAILSLMARSIAKNIKGNNEPPAVLRYLPAAGLVPGSEKYITGGILGHAFLDKGLMADYRIGQDVVKAFVAFFPSPDTASAAFSAYKVFLNKAGKKQQNLKGFGKSMFASEEPYHQHLLVGQQGTYVIGITDLSVKLSGQTLLERLMAQLKK